MAIELAELRRRIRVAVELAKKNAAAKRGRADAAAREYEQFLSQVAVPAVQQFASALAGEGHMFHVATPAGSVRMTSASAGDDYIEFALDTSQDEPFAVLRVNRTRGRRVVQHERPIKGRTPVDRLTEEDVLQALLDEIAPFVER